jgi:hypothetical protein
MCADARPKDFFIFLQDSRELERLKGKERLLSAAVRMR